MNARLSIISREEILRRICGEYLEMPGLRLTVAQAQRLWGLDEPTCSELLTLLVESQFLMCTVDGKYGRLTDGALSSSSLRMARSGLESEIPARIRRKPPAA